MKNLFSVLLLITSLLPLTMGWKAFAQETPDIPPEPDVTNPTLTQTDPLVKTNSVKPQQTTVATRACVKVGEPTEPKPAICNMPNTPVAGGFTAISGAGGFVHYCQNNTPPWPPATHCTLQSSGCGPTSLAMILSTFGAVCDGGTCTPSAIDAIMARNGQRMADCNSASASGVVQSGWFRNMGIEVGPSVLGGGFDFEAAKQRVNEGYLIVASASNAFSCKCSHIFVIQDVDPSTRSVVVRDPVCAGSNQEVNYNEGYSSMIRSGTLNWLYAVPVRAPQRGAAQQGAQ